MIAGEDLSEALLVLPEGSQVTGRISSALKRGVIGVFVDLPDGMRGFVDVRQLPRDADEWPEHVMDFFDALRRREERQLGEFRTKRLILDRYDAMAYAARTCTAYQTILDPLPGQGPRHQIGG